jgi:hypothetical protein
MIETFLSIVLYSICAAAVVDSIDIGYEIKEFSESEYKQLSYTSGIKILVNSDLTEKVDAKIYITQVNEHPLSTSSKRYEILSISKYPLLLGNRLYNFSNSRGEPVQIKANCYHYVKLPLGRYRLYFRDSSTLFNFLTKKTFGGTTGVFDIERNKQKNIFFKYVDGLLKLESMTDEEFNLNSIRINECQT